MMARRYVIIDGYNVMHAHPEYGLLARRDIDSARIRFISDLTAVVGEESRMVVVFDGAGNPASDGAPRHVGGLVVIFSPAGVTADTVIEALAQRARARGEAAMVVTSDGATRDAVRTGTVSVRSAESFVHDMNEARVSLADATRSASRGTVADRIDPSVREVLSRWARGEAR